MKLPDIQNHLPQIMNARKCCPGLFNMKWYCTASEQSEHVQDPSKVLEGMAAL